MIVGEGGLDPEYFLHKMQWWEVNRYLAGLRRRAHTPWENTRALQWWLACMFHNKKEGAPPAMPHDMYKFTWEEDDQPVEAQMTEEEAERLQKEMDRFQW